VQNFAFKFQAVAEKTAQIVRGLLYFAAPCIYHNKLSTSVPHAQRNVFVSELTRSFSLMHSNAVISHFTELINFF